MTEPQSGPRDSATMLAALGILAYAASMMTHEALGHGVYCLAAGGHSAMLTAWGERCNFPQAQPTGIEAAGPAVQFAAGLLAWWVLRRMHKEAIRWRYFLWLYMVFDLLVSSGYVAFSGVTNFGDAAVVIAGRSPPIVWRAGLIVLGIVAYYLSMWAAALELSPLAGPDRGGGRLFRLVWIPYAAAGVFACCSAALNKTMEHGTALGLAAASSFGGGLGLLRLPDMQRGLASKESSPTLYLVWSAAWGIAAALVIAGFLVFVGPGL